MIHFLKPGSWGVLFQKIKECQEPLFQGAKYTSFLVSLKMEVKSNKVFAADLNASVDGVYDLYRKDGNASAGTPLVQAEVPDGSVTTAKLDATILKYLKPEITSEPQAQTVYGETNATFSVTAEGKYLTYQWKKDG